MNYIIKTRWTAAFTHLLISILILISILATTYFIWFPGELIHAGAITGLRIVIGVDLVLGPLLTLIVFDRSKKSLKFDLLIVALIQLGCLAYGIWLLQNERPVAQVLADDGIYLITRSQVDEYELSLPKGKSDINPPAYLLELPSDWSSLPALKMTTELVSEKPFAYREDLYKGFGEINKLQYDRRVSRILKHLDEEQNLKKILDKDCIWLPIYSKHASGSACVSFKSGIILLSDHTHIF